MTTPTISYGHGSLQDCTTTTSWTKTEDGNTATFSCLGDDVFSLAVTGSVGNKVCYVKNNSDIDISPNTYPKVIVRYKTSDATIKAKIVLEDDTAATQTVLAESSSTIWKIATATLTLTGQVDHIILYANGATGTVYYDFVLICKGQFTFPFISGQVSLDATPRNIDIPIPGKVGDHSQNLGSPSCPIHLSGEIDSSTLWKDGNGVTGGILYDIAHNSYCEPWQWFTSDLCNMKAKIASGPLLSQVSNATRTYDLILKEFRGRSGSNETYMERDGHKICPICLDMDGYTWTFEVGKNQLGGTLVHPEHGIIWDTVSGSKVHEKPGLYGECHCSISYNIEMGDLVEKVRHLRDEIATLPQRE